MKEPIVFQLPTALPVMTVEQFAKELGMSERWVKEWIYEGRIPTIPKKKKQDKVLVNVAKYWAMALAQEY